METIIRYGNRKLYSLTKKNYVTLAELSRLPLGTFQVLDHKTKSDLTVATLRAMLVYDLDETFKKVVTKYLAEI